VHFLQIWVIPERHGLAPGYEQRSFSPAELSDQWCLVASGKPRDGAVKVHQDVDLYAARLTRLRTISFKPADDRRLWLQVARGSIEVDGETLGEGDGAAWVTVEALEVHATSDAEVLLFDMTP
jgi:redox-sensitive bicupin YhaK (pirin superfamily)